jgi:hypothetical protein
MKKQQHTAAEFTGAKLLAANGQQIARELSVSKEQEIDMDLASVHPIDTLLVHQLESILDREKDLRLKYSSMGAANSTVETRHAFSKELSALQDRADRLYRLINAMEYYGPLGSRTDGFNSTAVA